MVKYWWKSAYKVLRRKRTEVFYYTALLLLFVFFLFSTKPESQIAQKCPELNANRVVYEFQNGSKDDPNISPEIYTNSEIYSDAIQLSDNLIQLPVKIPSSEFCHVIDRPTDGQIKKFRNVYHVLSHFQNGSTAYFLNTYFDNRVQNNEDLVIRTVTASNFDLLSTGIYAAFWYPGLRLSASIKCDVIPGPGPAGANAYRYGFKRYTLTCEIPRKWSELPPEKVSLSVEKCAPPLNYIDVVKPLPKDKNQTQLLGNCMQSLYGNFSKGFALMFVNWMEAITNYGISEVTVNLNNFTNTDLGRRIFKYYQEKGVLKITNYPDIVPETTNKRELIVGRIQSFIQLPFVDCFFKNMNRYWYFVPLDVDELFVLNNRFKTYQEYLNYVTHKDNIRKNSRYLTTHVAGYYLDYMPTNVSVPEYLPLFRYTKRDRLRTGGHKKSFQNPRTCVFAGYHGCEPLKRNEFGFASQYLPPEEIVLNHYRTSCKRNDGCLNRKDAILDNSFKMEKGKIVEQRVRDTLKAIGYFK